MSAELLASRPPESESTLVLTLSNPGARNALHPDMYAAGIEALATAERDPGIRAVVLTGNGPAFCAGFDLKEIREADQRGERFRPPMNRPTRALFEVVTETPVPIVAALNGAAVAGGFELALACDLRVAAPGIKLGLPEAAIGMGANFGSVVLPKRIPMGIALEMLLTGRPYSAREAAGVGLIGHVVPDGAALEAALEIAERVNACAPLAVEAVKASVYEAAELTEADGLAAELARGWPVFDTDDAKEGARAFAERRAPVYRRA